MKRYEQACAIARALDVVGERWSLLLVRELIFGPRRYRDLATGLPGIPSNVLAARLKDLQAGRQVAVTARAKSQLPHEQEAPPLADDVQGSGDGACLPVVLHESNRKLYFYKCQLHWL